ncbi:unnamed protein product, partial [Musa textilis]
LTTRAPSLPRQALVSLSSAALWRKRMKAFCERESERDNNMQVIRGCFSPSCTPCALACQLSRSRCMPTELKQHSR